MHIQKKWCAAAAKAARGILNDMFNVYNAVALQALFNIIV
jgi:hypothetical protein